MESFPSSLSETDWSDWGWFFAFLFLGSPLMLKVWKADKKGLRELVSLLVLLVFFFCGWAFVRYLVR
ncbi:MAG: hypothetical protein HOK49_00120 [Opitutae bacterium]|jgi:hypothetical protein|nr:hypothetical protein [Opitutae bacterium]MBT5378862.1 hypothetical protein [Opitutae bacterium]MBT5689510.1 hypothetical protein [Opitutae bacterium]MBT6460923.1 hypothetical protein [Opitutae bacterium]MBT6958877.1 hypothetical protein [Opitutae bacterium]